MTLSPSLYSSAPIFSFCSFFSVFFFSYSSFLLFSSAVWSSMGHGAHPLVLGASTPSAVVQSPSKSEPAVVLPPTAVEATFAPSLGDSGAPSGP